MKRSIIIAAVALLGVLSFSACEMDNVDNEKPMIRIVAPVEDELVKPGSDIHFEVELSDNVALASYKVNIHGAFDGHTHNHAVGSDAALRSVEDEGVEFSKTWLESDFIALGEEPIAGKRNATVHHHHIEIPASIIRTINGEQKEMPLKEGHYHFIVYCTDESGQESFAATEIVISYDAVDHDHH